MWRRQPNAARRSLEANDRRHLIAVTDLAQPPVSDLTEPATVRSAPAPVGSPTVVAPGPAQTWDRPPLHLLVWRAITPLGRSVGALGILAWLGALVFGWAELGVLAVACFLSLAIGVAMLLAGGADLRVLLELASKRVVVGDPASTRIETTNAASRRMLPVRLEARIGKGVARVNVPTLATGESHDELLVIPTKRRSVVPVGPVRSVQGDPLGLVRREMVWTGTEDLFVHPKTISVGPLTTGFMRDLEGETTNDRSPSDVAFHTLREYVMGDDRRHIHWRTTARQPDGKLMVREFVDTRRAHLGLLLSLRTADYASEDEFELAVSALASFGRRAIGDEQEVSAIAGRSVLPSYVATSFLDALAGVDPSDDEIDLSAMAGRSRDLMVGASVAAIVTGSRADSADVRIATERIGRGVRTFVVRAEPGVESTVRTFASVPQLTLGDLEDLPRLTRAVTG